MNPSNRLSMMTGNARRGAALDSNCITYLAEALAEGYNPDADGDDVLRRERVALVRLLLYARDVFICPHSRAQVEGIPDEARRALQLLIGDVLLPEIVLREKHMDRVRGRIAELVVLHPDDEDCRILAEAEIGGAAVLLTRDGDFRNRLADASAIAIRTPKDYWDDLGLPHGIQPKIRPHPSNPLAHVDWWLW